MNKALRIKPDETIMNRVFGGVLFQGKSVLILVVKHFNE